MTAAPGAARRDYCDHSVALSLLSAEDRDEIDRRWAASEADALAEGLLRCFARHDAATGSGALTTASATHLHD